ncbi:MAG: hypothetical protein ACXACA_07175 [Candidatus Ranarchaeia archaeon]|jgi:hypothetical protein
MKRKLITGMGMRKKLFSISALVAILCLTPMFVMWASAQDTSTLIIDATGNFKGKGNCFQASSGTIDALLPATYNYDPVMKEIGGVTWDVSYGYANLPLPLVLVEDIMIHIHIDGAFRRLNVGVPVDITMLMITGCTVTPDDGVQYCVNAYSEIGNIGTVTKIGSNSWLVEALISDSERGSVGLCVNDWSGGEVVDGFCIPLHFSVKVEGTITK